MLLTERGSKVGIHSLTNSQKLFEHIRTAQAQGTPFPVIKAVDAIGMLEEIKSISPSTLTMARKTFWPGESVPDIDKDMDAAEILERAGAIMVQIRTMIDSNPNFSDWVDIVEIINESDPSTDKGYYNLGRILLECLRMGRLEYPDVKYWGIGSFNAGTPEWSEINAFLDSGILSGSPDDVILCVHEAVFTDEGLPGDVPVDKGFGDLLDGAPEVPENGGSMIGRVAYWELAAGEDMVPTIISEIVGGWNYNDPVDQAERLKWADSTYSEMWHVVAHLPFTHAPVGGWSSQDYTETYPHLLEYALEIEDRSNATKSVYNGPRVQYDREYWLLEQDISLSTYLDICELAFKEKRTVGFSYDDAGIGKLRNKKVKLVGQDYNGAIVEWYREHYPGTGLQFDDGFVEPVNAATTAVRLQYVREYHRVHDNATLEQYLDICRRVYETKGTVGFSVDDAMIGDLEDKTMIEYGDQYDRVALEAFRDSYYPRTKIIYEALPGNIELTMPLTGEYYTTSVFNDLRDYDRDGIYDDRHEGIDFAPRTSGALAIASQAGEVYHIGYSPTGYGNYVVLDHGSYRTWYCHMSRIDVVVGQKVAQKQRLGLVGNSGNSSGTHMHFNLQIPGKGLRGYVVKDVVDPSPYIDRTVIPYKHPVEFGLHATADAWLPDGEVNVFKTANIELVKVLSYMEASHLERLVANLPNRKWIIRAMFKPDGQNKSAERFFNETYSDVQRSIDVINAYGGEIVGIELHNEPNLKVEGWLYSWNSGSEFAVWIDQALALYKAALPNQKYIFPGLSPNGHIHDVCYDYLAFLNECSWVIPKFDSVGVHTYWTPDFPMHLALGIIDEYNLRMDKPLWITEASNPSKFVSKEVKGYEYIDYWEHLKYKRNIRGVVYFISSALMGFEHETWLHSIIPNIVASR